MQCFHLLMMKIVFAALDVMLIGSRKRKPDGDLSHILHLSSFSRRRRPGPSAGPVMACNNRHLYRCSCSCCICAIGSGIETASRGSSASSSWSCLVRSFYHPVQHHFPMSLMGMLPSGMQLLCLRRQIDGRSRVAGPLYVQVTRRVEIYYEYLE